MVNKVRSILEIPIPVKLWPYRARPVACRISLPTLGDSRPVIGGRALYPAPNLANPRSPSVSYCSMPPLKLARLGCKYRVRNRKRRAAFEKPSTWETHGAEPTTFKTFLFCVPRFPLEIDSRDLLAQKKISGESNAMPTEKWRKRKMEILWSSTSCSHYLYYSHHLQGLVARTRQEIILRRT